MRIGLKLLKRGGLICLLLLGFLLAMKAYDYRMGGPQDDSQSMSYLGTGVITNILKLGQYEYKDNQKNKRIVITDKKLKIGSLVGVSAKVQQSSSGLPWKDMPYALSHLGAFDYPRRLWMKGYQGSLKPLKIWGLESINARKDTVDIKDIPSSVFTSFIRLWIRQRIGQLYGESKEGGLLLGMLMGSRDGISEEDYNGFVSSGLVHIVAVSGSNVAMVILMMGILLFWVPYYIRLSFMAVAIVGYGLICGADSSIVRAVIMGLLSILALYGGKNTNSLRMIFISMLMMLARNPYSLLYDRGFALSFGAVISLSVVGDFWSSRVSMTGERHKKKPTKLQQHMISLIGTYIIPSLGVCLGIVPLLILFTGVYNLTSIAGNILTQPIVGLVTISGLTSMLIGNTPLVGSFSISFTRLLLQIIWYVSDTINNAGLLLVVDTYSRWIIVGLGVGALLLLSRHTRTQGDDDF